MATINYNGTGNATETEMDDVEQTAKDWRNGTDKILNTVEKRYDVGAVQLVVTWTVPDDQVEETVTTLDNAVSGMDADLPLASDGAATVEYGN
jgi:hypothetical protein